MDRWLSRRFSFQQHLSVLLLVVLLTSCGSVAPSVISNTNTPIGATSTANRSKILKPPYTFTDTFAEFPLLTSNSEPNEVAYGPDGNLWFTDAGGNQIGRITHGGKITEFPIPTSYCTPSGISAGSDGNLWFTEFGIGQIGRITPDGKITEFPLPTSMSGPEGITDGPDGSLWFTEANSNKIGLTHFVK